MFLILRLTMSPVFNIRLCKHLNIICIYKAGWIGRLDCESNKDVYGLPMGKCVGYWSGVLSLFLDFYSIIIKQDIFPSIRMVVGPQGPCFILVGPIQLHTNFRGSLLTYKLSQNISAVFKPTRNLPRGFYLPPILELSNVFMFI